MHAHTFSAGRLRPDDRSVLLETGINAGLAGGSMLLVVWLAVAAATGEGFWSPLRMMGTVAGAPMDSHFHIVAVCLGLGVHLVLSMLYGIAFTAMWRLYAWSRDWVVELSGIGFGLFLYVLNFHILAAAPPLAAFQEPAGGLFMMALHASFGWLLATVVLRRRDRFLYPGA